MSRKNNNFLVQGSILAAAGILTRVIGIIYRIPLTNILGDSGVALYGIAYDIYSLFLLISSLSLPLAVSKIVAARMADGQVINAKKAFKGSLILGTIIGLVVSFIVFVFADELASFWKFPSAATALKILAPTLFIMCILGVLRGFFQGLGTMVPTALSQIFEQIINAIVSVVAAIILYDAGGKVGKAAAYGAAGGTLGTAMGAFTALLFVVLVYAVYSRNFKKMVRRDRTSREESYLEVYKVLAVTIFPVLLSTTIYNITSIIDSAFYGNITSGIFKYSEAEYSPYWGIYSSQYRLLTTAPIAIASALSSAVVPSLIKTITMGNMTVLKMKIESAVRLTMIIAIPCGVGLSVLGDPITLTLFGNSELHEEVSKLMVLSFFVVAAYSYSTITNSILQGIDKMKIPVIHSAISLAFHLIILPVLLLLKLNIAAVAIADIIFSLMICIMNVLAIKEHTGYTQEMKKTFLIPLASAAIMGVITFAVYKGLNMITKMVAVPMFIAIIIAVAVYCILLMRMKAVEEEEIYMFPGGTRLVTLLKKMHLLA